MYIGTIVYAAKETQPWSDILPGRRWMINILLSQNLTWGPGQKFEGHLRSLYYVDGTGAIRKRDMIPFLETSLQKGLSL
jgi:hypothetical protein